MSAIIQLLAEHGLMLLGGATALLLAGTAAALLVRSPVHRQRVCELSVLTSLVWVILTSAPLPRVKIEAKHASPPVVVQSHTASPVTPLEIPPELIFKPRPAAFAKSTIPALPIPISVPHSSISPRIIVHLYLAGIAIGVAWLMLGYLLLRRTIHQSSPAPIDLLNGIDLAGSQQHRRLRILMASGLSRPVTCGAFRPTILLPASLLQRDRSGQLRQVLLHELNHVRQRDGYGGLLFNIALPLLYFHPLYWLLRRRSNLARELVVDDCASRADGKETYVAQLVDLARCRSYTVLSPIGTIGIFQTRSHFYRRMQMLLHRNEPLATRCSALCRLTMAAVALAVLTGSTLFIGVRPANAQAAPGDAKAADKTPTDRSEADRANAQIEKLIAEKRDIELELQRLKSQQAHNETTRPATLDEAKRFKDAVQAVDELTEKQIAMIDQNLRRMLAERAAIESEMGEQKAAGVLPENVRLLKLQAALADEQKKIDAYVLEWRDMQKKLVDMNGSFFVTRRAPEANATPAMPEAARVGGVQLDLVQLGNSLVDAAGAAQLAKVKFQVVDAIRKDGAKNELEFQTARVNFDTAEKRQKLLRDIAEIALRSAQNDLNLATEKYKKGLQTSESLSDANSKVQMLEAIIGAGK